MLVGKLQYLQKSQNDTLILSQKENEYYNCTIVLDSGQVSGKIFQQTVSIYDVKGDLFFSRTFTGAFSISFNFQNFSKITFSEATNSTYNIDVFLQKLVVYDLSEVESQNIRATFTYNSISPFITPKQSLFQAPTIDTSVNTDAPTSGSVATATLNFPLSCSYALVVLSGANIITFSAHPTTITLKIDGVVVNSVSTVSTWTGLSANNSILAGVKFVNAGNHTLTVEIGGTTFASTNTGNFVIKIVGGVNSIMFAVAVNSAIVNSSFGITTDLITVSPTIPSESLYTLTVFEKYNPLSATYTGTINILDQNGNVMGTITLSNDILPKTSTATNVDTSISSAKGQTTNLTINQNSYAIGYILMVVQY